MRDMQVHVKVLGAVSSALGALGLLLVFILLVGIGGTLSPAGASGDPDPAVEMPLSGIAVSLTVGVIGTLCLPALAAGIGLLSFKSWARVLGIILAAISLLGFPWFTTLGAYGLWVLLSKDSEHLFRAERPSSGISMAE